MSLVSVSVYRVPFSSCYLSARLSYLANEMILNMNVSARVVLQNHIIPN